MKRRRFSAIFVFIGVVFAASNYFLAYSAQEKSDLIKFFEDPTQFRVDYLSDDTSVIVTPRWPSGEKQSIGIAASFDKLGTRNDNNSANIFSTIGSVVSDLFKSTRQFLKDLFTKKPVVQSFKIENVTSVSNVQNNVGTPELPNIEKPTSGVQNNVRTSDVQNINVNIGTSDVQNIDLKNQLASLQSQFQAVQSQAQKTSEAKNIGINLGTSDAQNIDVKLEALQRQQKSDFQNLLQIITRTSQGTDFGPRGNNALVLNSPTIRGDVAGLDDDDIPNDITIQSSKALSASSISTGGDLTVTGNATVSGSLTVAGVQTFTGGTNFATNVGIASSTPGVGLSVGATTTILGRDVYVYGQLTIPYLISTSTTNSGFGTTSPGAVLAVSGGGLFKGNLNIEATSTASSFIATSTLSVGTSSPATLSSALSVQGNTYITGGLGIGVATTSSGGLFVKGSVDIYDGLVVRGGDTGIASTAPGAVLGVGGASVLGGNLNVTGVLDVQSTNASNIVGDLFVGTGASQIVIRASDPSIQLADSGGVVRTVLFRNASDQLSFGGNLAQITTNVSDTVVSKINSTINTIIPNTNFVGDIFIIGSDLNIGTGAQATSTISGTYGKLGFGSSTPYAQVSIEVDGAIVGSTTPVFTVGDLGTNTPLFVITSTGRIGIATNTPTVTANPAGAGSGFSVATSTYIDGGLGIGVATTSSGGLFVKGSADIYDGLIVRGGKIGLASSSPMERLTVDNGNIWQSSGTPIPKNGLNFPNQISEIYVTGRYAFLGANSADPDQNEFMILDVSDIASTTEISSVDLGAINTLKVSGRYAYLGLAEDADKSELVIYDVSNVASTTEVGSIEIGSAVTGIVVSGRYLYLITNGVAGTCSGTTLTGCEFRIYDISNPASPVALGGVANDVDNYALEVRGRYAYIGNNNPSGTCSGSTNNGCSFQIFDISNPALPNGVGGAEPNNTSVSTIDISDRFAYLGVIANADADKPEFQIYDISNVASTTEVAAVDLGSNLNEIDVRGRYAYLAMDSVSGNDFLIYDVSRARAPDLIGGIDLSGFVYGLHISGHYAYISRHVGGTPCAGNDITGCTFRIYDLLGIEAPGGTIHSLETGSLQVRNNLIVQGNIQSADSINIGTGGLLSYGTLSVISTTTGSGVAALLGGDVGIGTSTPGYRLAVEGFGVVKGNFNIEATSTASSFNATSTLSVASSSPTSPFAVVGRSVFGGGVNITGDLDVQGTATSSLNGGLEIERSGFVYDFSSNLVGIGTAEPIDDLTIFNTGGPGIVLHADDGIGTGRIRYIANGSGNDAPELAEIRFDRAPASGNNGILTFWTANTSLTASERMRITETGNIGIGTINPSQLLEVAGASLLGGNAEIVTDLFVYGADINLGTGSATTTLTAASTNLGISSTTPGAKLAVEGFGVVKGNLNIEATSTASSFIATSTLSVGTSSPATLSSALSVQGNTYITGGLGIGVATTTNGGLFVKNSLDVYEGITLRRGRIDVAGSATSTFTGDINANLLHSDTQLVLAGLLSCDTLDTDANGVVKCGTDGGGAAETQDLQDVYNQAGVDAQITTADAKDIIFSLGDTATDPNFIVSVASDAQGQLQIAVGSTTNAVWEGYGRLGIGTTTPGAGLSVHATTTVLGSDLYVFGQVTAPTFVATSTGFRGPNGSVSAPTYSFSNDTNSGLFSFGDDAVDIAAGGTSRLRVSTNVRVTSGSAGTPGLVDISNQDSGLFWPAAGVLGFSADSAERMRINSSGLGIGTTTPGARLAVEGFGVVKGNWNIEATSTASSFIATSTLSVGTSSPATASSILSVQGNAYITQGLGVGVATTSAGGLFVKGSADIYDGLIIRGGNVGIGTQSPVRPFHITASELPQFRIQEAGGIFWDIESAARFNITDDDGTIRFSIGEDLAPIGQVNIDVSGNLGIGTGDPNQLLHVAGASFLGGNVEIATDLFVYGSDLNIGNGLQATSTISGEYGKIGFGSTTPFGQVSIEAVQGIAGSNTPIFVVGDSGSSSPFIYVSGNAGYTGFGTSAPWGRVSVEILDTGDEETPSFVVGDTGSSTPALAVYSSGVTTIDQLQTGVMSFDTNAGLVTWVDMPVTSGATWGTVEGYTAEVDASTTLAVYSVSDGKGGILNQRIGISTTTPGATLSITHSTTSVPALLIDGDSGRDLIYTGAGRLGLGSTSPRGVIAIDSTDTVPALLINAAGAGDGNVAISVDAGDLCEDGSADGACALNDLAELFPYDPVQGNLEAGDIVVFDSEKPLHLVRASIGISNAGTSDVPKLRLAGVISTSPAVVFEGGHVKVMGGQYKPESGKVPLALSGRAPVKISLENGPIKINDPIALSTTTPGVGVKATESGYVVGYALENYETPSLRATGGSEAISGEIATVSSTPRNDVPKILIIANASYWIAPNFGTSDVPNIESSSVQDIGSPDTDAQSLFAKLLQFFLDYFNQAIVKFKELVVDKLIASVAHLLKLEVGTSEQPTGVTVYDLSTRSPFCIVVRDSKVEAIPGGCTFEVASQSTNLGTSDVPALGTSEISAEGGSSSGGQNIGTPEVQNIEVPGTAASSSPDINAGTSNVQNIGTSDVPNIEGSSVQDIGSPSIETASTTPLTAPQANTSVVSDVSNIENPPAPDIGSSTTNVSTTTP